MNFGCGRGARVVHKCSPSPEAAQGERFAGSIATGFQARESPNERTSPCPSLRTFISIRSSLSLTG